MGKDAIKQRTDKIRAWFDRCDVTTTQTHDALKRAAITIFSYQTPEEQAGNHTHDLNGVGFSRYDADFGRRISLWDGTITDQMARGAKTMLRRYAKQLASHALKRT